MKVAIQFSLIFFLGLVLTRNSLGASPGNLPFDISQFASAADLLLSDTANVVVSTVGVLSKHRPYEPATPLGMLIGLDLSAEATLAQFPAEFKSALKKAGLSSADSLPPAAPMPKIHVHKGITPFLDVGLSGIVYQTYRIIGGDMKIIVHHPDEGLTWAIRMNVSQAKLGFVECLTYNPQILISRALAYADPFIGIGADYMTGKLAFEQNVLGMNLKLEKEAKPKLGFESFMGVAFKLGPTGLRLVMQGSYSTLGVNTMGVKFGLNL